MNKRNEVKIFKVVKFASRTKCSNLFVNILLMMSFKVTILILRIWIFATTIMDFMKIKPT